jgi:hypothetical protein
MTPFPQSRAQTVSFARESLLLKLNSGGCPLGAYRRTLCELTSPSITKDASLQLPHDPKNEVLLRISG